MREILFRGKRVSDGEWVEGQLLYFNASVGTEVFALIVSSCEWDNANEWFNLGKRAKVIPSTIGQYTGLTDKNGKKIFEGDIVKTHYANATKADFIELVVFRGGKYCAMNNLQGSGRTFAPLADGVLHVPCDKSVYMDCVEVIGNIHDTPELLKGGDER